MRLVASFILIFLSLSVYSSERFASYNIRNFDYDERSNTPTNKHHLVETIKKMNPDFMAVQEINEAFVFENMIQTLFEGKYTARLTDCGGTHGQKLGFVYDPSKFELIDFQEDMRTVNPNNPTQEACDGSRPIAIGTFIRKRDGQKLIALSVHLKSGGQPKSISKRFKQINIIAAIIHNFKMQGIENFIVMGDFNSTEYIFKGQHYKQFMHLVNTMGVVDVSSSLACTAYWWGQLDDQTQYPSQLDHILMSQSLVGKETKANVYGHCQKLQCKPTLESEMGVDFNEVSDHCPIMATSK